MVQIATDAVPQNVETMGEALLPSLLSERPAEQGKVHNKDPPVEVVVETPELAETDTHAPNAWALPLPVRGVAHFCERFGQRIWQLCLYTTFVAPPSILAGIACAILLFAIKVATAFRNGTCASAESGFAAFLDTKHPLIACTAVVGARRWLFFLLSFSGMLTAALYTYIGNANAAGGFNTVLLSIRKLEDEINRMSEEAKRREEAGEPPAAPVQSADFNGMVSLRMCPLVWFGTVSTHLCGGSAGREGSALQMAAPIFSKYCDFIDSICARIAPRRRVTAQLRRAALVAAIAAGFSGVFGVPVTGAIFAVEVLRVGEITVGEMLTPAIMGSFCADWACRFFNDKVFGFEGHSEYECLSCQGNGIPQNWQVYLDFEELLAVVPAAIAFGLCDFAFEWLLHSFKDLFGKVTAKVSGSSATAKALLTPFIGGWVVVLMWLVLCSAGTTSSFNLSPTYDGTDARSATFAQAYLGLSVYEPGVSINSCFLPQPIHGEKSTPVQSIMWYSFLLKLLFTTVTLGAGFKGGEVTPLFFIGAALGNVCGVALGQDPQLFAALGFVGVFAAAANTPIACTIMGIELFGGAKVLPFFLACYLAYLVSNTEKVSGIYAAQDKPRGGPVTVTPFSRRAPHRV
jgi:H+/Cl- antiporter ClcA